MSRIERLTPAQEAALPRYREKWLKAGLSTLPADRPEAESAIADAYRVAGLEPPRLKVWVGSPMAGALGQAVLRAGDQVEDQVRAQVGDHVWAEVGAEVLAQVWTQVRNQAGDQVRAQVRDQVWTQVRDQVSAQVWTQVGAKVRNQAAHQVWDQVSAQVSDQARAQVSAQVWIQVSAQAQEQVRDQVEAQVRDQVEDLRLRLQEWSASVFWGQHDADWLSFYDSLSFTGLADKLEPLSRLAQAAGWCWLFSGAVVMSERPRLLRLDERGRLHCADGKAIEYPDGWGLYALHGVRVDARYIEDPETITLKEVLEQPNQEVRRVLMDKYGVDRLLEERGERIAEDEFGVLWRVDFANEDEPWVLVRVDNSTPEPDGSIKPYLLRVPPSTKSAHDGVAWTFGLDAQTYRPVVET